jgi:rubrerythrin
MVRLNSKKNVKLGDNEASNAIKKFIVTKCICQHCNYSWIPRVEKPRGCPNCNVTNWHIPRKTRRGKK